MIIIISFIPIVLIEYSVYQKNKKQKTNMTSLSSLLKKLKNDNWRFLGYSLHNYNINEILGTSLHSKTWKTAGALKNVDIIWFLAFCHSISH